MRSHANGEQGTRVRKRSERNCGRRRQKKRALFTRTIVGLLEPERLVKVRRAQGIESRNASGPAVCSQWGTASRAPGSREFPVGKKPHIGIKFLLYSFFTRHVGVSNLALSSIETYIRRHLFRVELFRSITGPSHACTIAPPVVVCLPSYSNKQGTFRHSPDAWLCEKQLVRLGSSPSAVVCRLFVTRVGARGHKVALPRHMRRVRAAGAHGPVVSLTRPQ